jgi:hypothetical protein
MAAVAAARLRRWRILRSWPNSERKHEYGRGRKARRLQQTADCYSEIMEKHLGRSFWGCEHLFAQIRSGLSYCSLSTYRIRGRRMAMNASDFETRCPGVDVSLRLWWHGARLLGCLRTCGAASRLPCRPRPRRRTPLRFWGRTDGASLRYGLATEVRKSPADNRAGSVLPCHCRFAYSALAFSAWGCRGAHCGKPIRRSRSA